MFAKLSSQRFINRTVGRRPPALFVELPRFSRSELNFLQQSCRTTCSLGNQASAYYLESKLPLNQPSTWAVNASSKSRKVEEVFLVSPSSLFIRSEPLNPRTSLRLSLRRRCLTQGLNKEKIPWAKDGWRLFLREKPTQSHLLISLPAKWDTTFTTMMRRIFIGPIGNS